MTSKRVFAAAFLVSLLLGISAVHAAVPSVSGISPNRGPVGGGTVVIVSGSGLTGTTSVTFDGIAGTALLVLSDTQVRVTTPAHAVGTVNVILTNPDGSATLVEGYGYGNVPLSADDAFTGAFNTPLQVFPSGVLSNDNDSGGGTMTPAVVTDVASGTLSLSTDGGFLYTPVSGFVGSVTFTYRATNTVGPGNLGRVTITVAAPTGPGTPTGLYVAALNGNSVTLRWTPAAFGLAATGHIVEGGTLPGDVLGTLTTGSAATSFTFTAPSGTLYFRVRATAAGQQSSVSNEVRVFVNTPAVPSAPENLLGLVNGASLVLAWRNTFGGGQPTSMALDVTGSTVTTLSLGVTDSFSFGNVPAGTYTFTVRAINGLGTSAASAPVTLTFPGACSGAPLAPANFVVTLAGNTITVSWDLPASGPAPTGYVLNVTGGLVGNFQTPTRQMSGAVGPGSYTLSVSATNACGASAPTTAQTVVVP